MSRDNADKMVVMDRSCPHCKKELPPSCPACGSHMVTCNGRAGIKQKYRCECGKQFISDPSRSRIDHRVWRNVDILLGDGVKVTTINKVTGVSARSIYNRKSTLGP